MEAKTSIQVIDRMMSLLDVLADHTEPVGLKQLAQLTGLHPSSAHRILAVMVEKRLAERVEPGAYRLGIKLLTLGTLVKSRLNVRQVALPFMHELNERLGETANLILRQGDEAVYVERTSSGKSTVRVIHVIGARAPLHVTAVGKIFLAADGPHGCAEYAHRTGLPAYTRHSITDLDSLCAAVAEARRNGYAFDHEEAERGVCCVGAGIYDAGGKLVAGLSVSAPAERMDEAWALQVKQSADRISRALGFRGN